MLLKRISLASVGVVAAAVGIGLKPMMIANANGFLVASNRANLSAPPCRSKRLDLGQSAARGAPLIDLYANLFDTPS